jgi:hypothetical protein
MHDGSQNELPKISLNVKDLSSAVWRALTRVYVLDRPFMKYSPTAMFNI